LQKLGRGVRRPWSLNLAIGDIGCSPGLLLGEKDPCCENDDGSLMAHSPSAETMDALTKMSL